MKRRPELMTREDRLRLMLIASTTAAIMIVVAVFMIFLPRLEHARQDAAYLRSIERVNAVRDRSQD